MKLADFCVGKNRVDKLLDIPQGNARCHMGNDYRKAGIEIIMPHGKATWHSLRKTFVNSLVKQGHDLKTIMTLARHSTASLTMETYAQAEKDTLRTAVEHLAASKKASPWCTGVTSGKSRATREIVKGSPERGLDESGKIPATGFEPVTNGL